MTTMTVYKDVAAKCWVAAEFVDGKPNPTLVKLFGTHKIPTPFTTAASGEQVYTELQRLNPETKITLVIE